MEPVVITPALIFTALLSLALEWLPGVSTWFAALTPAKKTSINALGVTLVSIISVVGGCYWWGSVCPENVWQAIGNVLLLGLLGMATNQGVYQATKRETLLGKSRKARQA